MDLVHLLIMGEQWNGLKASAGEDHNSNADNKASQHKDSDGGDNSIGMAYYNGEGVKKDEKEAREMVFERCST
jgi:TPR repeat protein